MCVLRVWGGGGQAPGPGWVSLWCLQWQGVQGQAGSPASAKGEAEMHTHPWELKGAGWLVCWLQAPGIGVQEEEKERLGGPVGAGVELDPERFYRKPLVTLNICTVLF